MRLIFLSAVLLTPALVAPAGWTQAPGSGPFERVFARPPVLDAETVAKVKALPAGERLELDTNGDGRVNELWYMEARTRHTKEVILVVAVDEDGDMADNGRPDLDSDLYLYDWDADGVIDAVTGYQDDDGDNDVDAMGLFFGGPWDDPDKPVIVWWGEDIGDDNLLWYDVNGTYYQNLCQYRTHFSGDETFYQFKLTAGDEAWLNVFEDPFSFYDIDGDTCSEVVVRICATGHDLENLRYSMDADDDAHGRRTHDYDFSITALPGEAGVKTHDGITASIMVRGIPTHPVLRWPDTRPFAEAAPWARACLTWDEINANTEKDVARDPNERWEGIINHKTRVGDFPQVGGPPTSNLNKRVEVSHAPASPLRLYYNSADRRLHLLGANEGYIDVDHNLDGEVDAVYAYYDSNGDGVLDERTIDLDADGAAEITWAMAGNEREFYLAQDAIAAFYTEELERVLEESQRFIDYAKSLLEDNRRDPIEEFFLEDLPLWRPERELGARMRSTPAGARYYTDLVRDRLFWRLKRQYGTYPEWSAFEKLYAAGKYGDAAEYMADAASLPRPNTSRFGAYTNRAAVEIDNVGGPQRDAWPIVLRVAALQDAAPDFNPANCAVVAPERWLDWREIPHQVDEIDPEAGRELSFLANLPADKVVTYYVYYAPVGAREVTFPHLTRAVLDNPAYIAWESEWGAFRFYTGQFDFFGKQRDRMPPNEERLLYPLIDVNYHAEQDWGIDALHVGKTSGLGGLTLRIGQQEWLVQSPAGEGGVRFTHRVLTAGPVRAAVEILAENIVPGQPAVQARLTCLVYAGRQESEIRARILGAEGPVTLAPGLLKLPDEQVHVNESLGVLGSTGFQEDAIGDIGLGVVVPADVLREIGELDAERRLLCDAPSGELRYWIIGDWRRGRQYPIAPTITNWGRELDELAEMLNRPVKVTIAR